MSIQFEILGRPDTDNALYVEVDTGKSVSRLLFDCGEGCLANKSFGQIQKIDQVFFSHFHMDHISGFDSLFRCVYGREQPIEFWGPANASSILQHRFQGFWWNLVEDQHSQVFVNRVESSTLCRFGFRLSQGFAKSELVEERQVDKVILDSPAFEVRVIELNHNGPCLGYRVNEKARLNVDLDAMGTLGLTSGPWLRTVKEENTGQIEINNQVFEIAELRNKIMVESTGDSIAYLTDFRLDAETGERLSDFIDGCSTVVCEAQYRKEDLELAQKNFHTTTDQVSKLAAQAQIEKLILFHLSDRYPQNEWVEMLDQARENFSNTNFADHWLQ